MTQPPADLPDQQDRGAEVDRGHQADARYLLANERTLLAWLRTCLAFVATGIALVALRRAGVGGAWPLIAAAVSCLVGMASSIWAYLHFQQVDRAVRGLRPMPQNTAAPALVTAVVVIALTGLVAVLTHL